MPTGISADHVNILEKYILLVYYGKFAGPADIDIQRMRDFKHSTHNNLRQLPQHIKSTAYEAGGSHTNASKTSTYQIQNNEDGT